MARAYAAYYGVILLQLEEEDARELDQLFDINEEQCYEQIRQYQLELVEKLKANSNISDIKYFDVPIYEYYGPAGLYGEENKDYLSKFSRPIKLTGNLKKEERTYKREVRNANSLAEEFHVIYNGELFLAYVPIEEACEETRWIGQEIREFLVKALETDRIKPRILPPCPIRTSFAVESIEERKRVELFLEVFFDAIEEQYYKNSNDVNGIMLSLFYDNEFFLERFIELMSLSRHIEALRIKIDQKHSDIRDLFNDSYLKNKEMNVKGRIKKSIFKLYELLYLYDVALDKYCMERDSLWRGKEPDVSDYLIEYVEKELVIYPLNAANIINGIQYIEETINNRANNWNAVISAVLGGIIGSVATVIATLIASVL